VNAWRIAALPLLGWYLMLPPDAGAGHRRSYEPLYKWLMVDSFASERACEAARAELVKRMPKTAIATSRCVSSDDPKLPRRLQRTPAQFS
jgi:hypothetical protein